MLNASSLSSILRLPAFSNCRLCLPYTAHLLYSPRVPNAFGAHDGVGVAWIHSTSLAGIVHQPGVFTFRRKKKVIRAPRSNALVPVPYADRDALPEYVVDEPDYPSGRPWRPMPVKPLFEGLFRQGRERYLVHKDMSQLPPYRRVHRSPQQGPSHASGVFTFGAEYDPSVKVETLYYRLLHVIATTQSADHAWIAYCSLLERSRPTFLVPTDLTIPYPYLHRLARLLSRNRPKTRSQFLRLLSVLYTIQSTGGRIQLFEWNAVIDNAGKGWRKTQPSDFKFALEVFMDMVSGTSPGATHFPSHFPALPSTSIPVVPDIVTYTTLINLAGNTLNGSIIRQATSLLQASGLPPSRITHLALLKYFSNTQQLSGVRSTLFKMKRQGLDLGIDGINLVIWAFGVNNRIDVVANLYRILRHGVYPEDRLGLSAVQSLIQTLLEDENIPVVLGVRPNEISFTSVIQILLYNGHFEDGLKVFLDMLNTENLEVGAPLISDQQGRSQPTRYTPTLVVFRAFFLGFSKHGVYVPSNAPLSKRLKPWNLCDLNTIYDMFMKLDAYPRPSVSVIYWIMVAFDKTSNHDVELLRRIWTELETKFNGPWGGEANRLQILREILFSDQAYPHLNQFGFRMSNSSAPPW